MNTVHTCLIRPPTGSRFNTTEFTTFVAVDATGLIDVSVAVLDPYENTSFTVVDDSRFAAAALGLFTKSFVHEYTLNVSVAPNKS